MLLRTLCLASVIVLYCRALPTPAWAPAFESMATLRTPHGWVKRGTAPREQRFELTFALKQRNTDRCADAVDGAT